MASAADTSVSISSLHGYAISYTNKTTQAPQARDRLSSLLPELVMRILSSFEYRDELRVLLRACPACHYVYVENKRQILKQTIINSLIHSYRRHRRNWGRSDTVIPDDVVSEAFVAGEVNAIVNLGRSFEEVQFRHLGDHLTAVVGWKYIMIPCGPG